MNMNPPLFYSINTRKQTMRHKKSANKPIALEQQCIYLKCGTSFSIDAWGRSLARRSTERSIGSSMTTGSRKDTPLGQYPAHLETTQKGNDEILERSYGETRRSPVQIGAAPPPFSNLTGILLNSISSVSAQVTPLFFCKPSI